MDLQLSAPVRANATIALPSSKSISNRALLIAALCGDSPQVLRPALCDDTAVMIEALEPKPAVATKKEEPKPAAATKKEEPAKQSTNDTTTKKVEPAKSKVPSTVNPDNVQFDGIDISKHQGTINWEELKKNQKIKFIYIKATEGSDFVDPSYRDNIRNARKHGFKVGSYHFLSTRSAATTQFYNFIRTAKREDQDLLPIIDVEKISPWSPQQLRDSVKVFADLIEDYYGCKPLIYTSEKFFRLQRTKRHGKVPRGGSL